jgi:hypothetical protein
VEAVTAGDAIFAAITDGTNVWRQTVVAAATDSFAIPLLTPWVSLSAGNAVTLTAQVRRTNGGSSFANVNNYWNFSAMAVTG